MTMSRKKKSIGEVEGAEFGVNSVYTSKKEKLSDGKALMELAVETMELKDLSDEQVERFLDCGLLEEKNGDTIMSDSSKSWYSDMALQQFDDLVIGGND